MKALSSVLLPVFLVSCALDPEQASSKLDDVPVDINHDAIPNEVPDSAIIENESQVSQPTLKPKGKLGFRTPDLVNSLPTESQTTGSAPELNTIDEEVNNSTTIRATD